ncbi:MAG TPA: RdgB/HAM1 family non-canonical purine NTP pyrophosphatase [Longimicrobium sp.]|jgi:XTP/dITP diphosphohydrolase|uniref:RdgB/HAM1 family non-canonical purine NTP pyrophosphatase n=1 Tax=Longimicrobium sp. TaxID=2029185 RepID=UPI002EDAB739
MTRLVVATRNPGKVREIREILADAPNWEVVGLDDLGIPESPEEDDVEAYETFEENALAKARWFAAKTGALALADDSGLCVDALDGRPGVRSRRFAPVDEARGERQDEANNRHLLALLAGVPDERRTARYVCAAAAAWPDGRELVRTGTCEGVILPAPRGTGGFGYDPLFYIEDEGQTFGELPAERKNARSHRGRAVRALVQALSAVNKKGAIT